MSDLTPIGLEFRTVGGEAANRAADQYTEKVGKAEKGTDALAGSQKRAGTATAQMLASIERAVVELAEIARVQGQAGSAAAAFAKQQVAAASAAEKAATSYRMGKVQLDAHVLAFQKAQAGSKLLGHEMLNLSRQFSDVAVTAAMGMNPLMILIQQGPQIGETLAVASARGVSFKAALLEAAAAAWAFMAPWAGIVAVLGLFAGAIYLAIEYNKSLSVASKEVTKDIAASDKAIKAYTDAADAAASATDELKVKANQVAQAHRQAAVDARDHARAELDLARASLATIKAQNATLAQPNGNPLTANPEAAMGQAFFQGGLESKAAANLKARAKAYEEAVKAVSEADDKLYGGARRYLQSLQEQNAEVGKTRAQVILMRAEKEAAATTDAKLAAQIRETAKAYAASVAAEDGAKASRRAATKANSEADREAKAAAAALSAEIDRIKRESEAAAAALQKLTADVKSMADAFGDPAARQFEERMSTLREAMKAGLIQPEDFNEWATAIQAALAAKNLKVPVKPDISMDALDKQAKDFWKSVNDNAELKAAAKDRLATDIGYVFSDGVMAAFDGSLGSFLKRTFANLFNDTLGGLVRGLASSVLRKTATSAVGSAAGSALGLAGGAALGIGGASIAAGGGAAAAGGAAAGAAAAGGAAAGGGGLLGAAGAALASNPVGWAIAGIGLVAGIFGVFGSSKKKREQEEARQRALEEEAQRQAAIRQGIQQQEIETLRLEGKEREAVLLQRKYELDAMEPALRLGQERIYQLQDEAEALAKLKQAEADAKQAVASAEDALREAYRREAADLQAVIDRVGGARDDLVASYEREASRLKEVNAAAAAVVTTLDGLLATLSKEIAGGASYGSARADLRSVGAKAALGDFDAANKLPGMVQEFLPLARANAKTELDYARDVAAARAIALKARDTAARQVDVSQLQLDQLTAQVGALVDLKQGVLSVEEAIRNLQTATDAATAAEAQLGALTTQVGALITINESVLGVQAAIANLATAQAALAAATAAAAQAATAAATAPSGTKDFAAYVNSYPDLAAEYAKIQGPGLAALGITDQASYGQYHYANFGQAEGRVVPTFATGGLHAGGLRLVGERGPEIEATGPSRIWSAEQTASMLGGGDNSDLVTEVRALRAEMKAELQAIRRSTGKSSDVADKLWALVMKLTLGKTALRVTTVSEAEAA